MKAVSVHARRNRARSPISRRMNQHVARSVLINGNRSTSRAGVSDRTASSERYRARPSGDNKPLYAAPVTPRPGMHTNEISMNAPIKKGRRSRFPRHLNDYVLAASPSTNARQTGILAE